MAVTSAAVTSVVSSGSSVLLLASNIARRQANFFNDSTSAVYLKFGSGATTSSFTVKILAAGYYEVPWDENGIYTGDIYGIWDSVNGSMRVTEVS
jgi:hypothetical protein